MTSVEFAEKAIIELADWEQKVKLIENRVKPEIPATSTMTDADYRACCVHGLTRAKLFIVGLLVRQYMESAPESCTDALTPASRRFLGMDAAASLAPNCREHNHDGPL